MMDPFEKYISSQDTSTVSADDICLMGKKAAAKYLSDGVPLTDTVAELAKEASLNNEQIKRTVEAANNETFSLLFKQPFKDNISFEMADYKDVQKSLGRHETEKTASPLKVTKAAKYIPGMETVSIADAFRASESFEKTAAAGKDEEAEKRAAKERAYAFVEVRELRKRAEADLDYAVSDLAMALRKLSDEAKNVVRDGADLYKTAALINAASPDGETSEYLLSCLELPIVELSKSASISPNEQHPVYLATIAAAAMLEKTAALAEAHHTLVEKEAALKEGLRGN